MGKLIKNHLARLLILVSSICEPSFPPRQGPASNHALPSRASTDLLLPDQIAAALEGFFWPKIFFDFLTKNLDGAVKPYPILQSINLLFGIIITCWEWPLPWIAGSWFHRSIHARMVVYPMAALSSVILYQATNPAIYYSIGIILWIWAYSEDEKVAAVPWTLPKRRSVGKV